MMRQILTKGFRALQCALALLVLVPCLPQDAAAYVVPPEQLLEFMAENVVGFETLGVTWEHRGGTGEAGGDAAVVDVWCRSGGDVLVRPGPKTGVRQPSAPDPALLDLFCGKPHLIERFIARLGVDVKTSSYTRLDREVVYRIGREGPNDPVLLLEKGRFVPLLLTYEPLDAGPGERLEIRFREYRRIGEGWFPHEMFYRSESGVTGVYAVEDLRLEASRPTGTFKPESSEGDAPSRGGESDRLERVIRAFEKKYGQGN